MTVRRVMQLRRRGGRRLAVEALGSTALASALVACFEPPGLPEPTTVVGLVPQGVVQPGEAVALVFSGPVPLALGSPDGASDGGTARPGPVQVRDADGRSIAMTVTADGSQWYLDPNEGWPAGELLTVAVEGPLLDASGRNVDWPVDGLAFEVAPRVPTRRPSVRWPTPGIPAPASVRWVVLEDVEPDLVMVDLQSDAHSVTATRREAIDGLTRFTLEGGPCSGLCGGEEYRLDVESVAAGVRGRVVTSTSADDRPPVFSVAEVDLRPRELEFRWACDEPVRITARMTGPDLGFEEVVGIGRAGVWRSDVVLTPEVRYDLSIWATDLSERATMGVETRIVGPDELQVILQEAVPTALSDWGDSEPRGAPFDASPGRGTVSSADEWVELINASEQSIDVETVGLRILTLDRTPAETLVSAAPARRFGDGGSLSDWRPGEALVVRPRGDMAQTDLTIEVWAGAVLLDRLMLGDGPESDHPGGSPPALTRESLARSSDGRWRWCRPTPGDPRPNAECGR